MFSFKRIMKYVWPSMRKFRGLFLGCVTIFSVRAVLDLVRPLFFKKIVDLISSGPLDRTLLAGPLMHIVYTIIAIFAFSVTLNRISKYMHLKFEISVIEDLRNTTFEKIGQRSHSFFANMFAGSLVTKSKRFVASFETMYDIFEYNFLFTGIVVIAALCILHQQSSVIFLFFLVWVVVFITVVSIFVKKKIVHDLAEAAADSRISGHMADVFTNAIAVKTFSAKQQEEASFTNLTADAAQKSRKAWFFSNRIDAVQSFMNLGLQSAVLLGLIHLWLVGTISAGTVVLVQTYFGMVADRLWDLGNSLSRFMKAAADMQEMVDIFEMPIDVLDPVHPEVSHMKEGHIVFDDVSFAYSEGRTIFEHLNLDVKPGERIGLVGHSGAGKSTITKLLLRFTDVTGGAIRIDGQDIRNVTQDDLHRALSYVPQEPVLFHRTIRENISYGSPDATLEEVIEAAKRAHAHEFISTLDKGYDTYVGERGVKLSGGERQRIAIARAILKNAPILLLDEATSALDSQSEVLIQDAFNELMKGKTTIVIAHRLATIQKMDRIIVMESGQLVEEGTHTSLVANPESRYKQLWDLQAGGFINDEDEVH